jgi:crossover junction endodeoxyribonuclease RusA
VRPGSASLFEPTESTHPPSFLPGTRTVSFFVPGTPATQGSKRAFIPKGWTRAIIVEDCKRNKDWRGDVKSFALEATAGEVHDTDSRSAMVRLTIAFFMPRPKGHVGRRGLLPSAPKRPTTKPDCTKMLRSVEDALKGILWADDSQVVEQVISKHYADETPPGAQVTVEILEG